MPKRTPEEVLATLEQTDVDDEMERVLAMSSEERRRELERAGVDLRKLDARVGALRESAGAGVEPAPTGSRVAAAAPTPRGVARGWATRLAAALSFAALALAVARLGLGVATHSSAPDATPGVSTNPVPERMRQAAFEACADQKWQACLEGLRAAREIDPAGDAEGRVQAAWRTATDALRARSPQPRTPEPTP